MQAFIEAQHAAEAAVLAMSARALLVRASREEPDIVALVVSVTAADVEFELQNRDGLAIGGGTL